MSVYSKMKSIRQDYERNKECIERIKLLVESQTGDFLYKNRLGFFDSRKEFHMEYSLEIKQPQDMPNKVFKIKDLKISLAEIDSDVFDCDVASNDIDVYFVVRAHGKVSCMQFSDFFFDSKATFVGKSYGDLHLIDYRGNLKKDFTAFDIEKAILVDNFIDAQELDDFIMMNKVCDVKEVMQ